MGTPRDKETGRRDSLGRLIKESSKEGQAATSGSVDATGNTAISDFSIASNNENYNKRVFDHVVLEVSTDRAMHHEILGWTPEVMSKRGYHTVLPVIDNVVKDTVDRVYDLQESDELLDLDDQQIEELAEEITSDSLIQSSIYCTNTVYNQAQFVNLGSDPVGKIVDHSSTLDREDVRHIMKQSLGDTIYDKLDDQKPFSEFKELLEIENPDTGNSIENLLREKITSSDRSAKHGFNSFYRALDNAKNETARRLLQQVSDKSEEEIKYEYSAGVNEYMSDYYESLNDNDLFDTYVDYSDIDSPSHKKDTDILDAAYAAQKFDMTELSSEIIMNIRDKYNDLV